MILIQVLLMIRIIVLGKPREPYVLEGVKEYSKRLRKYSKVEVIYVKKESDILKNSQGKLILLDEHGRQPDSMEFSKILLERNLTFCMGPSDGFSREFLNGKQSLSLSRLTLMHQLALVVLLEQVYRGFTILNNEPYHRD